MEVTGDIKCIVESTYDDVVIDKEKFVKANLVELLKKKYNFTEVRVPSEEEYVKKSIFLKGGKFVHDSSEFLIDELEVGNSGLKLSMWEKTSIVETAINEITKMIESTGISPKLSSLTPKQEFETDFKAKLAVSTAKFLSAKFLNVIEKFSKEFKKEDFDTEIHPYGIALAYVFKPNIQKLARKSLSATELARMFKEIDRRSLAIEYSSLDEFYKGVVLIRSNFDYETTKRMLEEIEHELSSEP